MGVIFFTQFISIFTDPAQILAQWLVRGPDTNIVDFSNRELVLCMSSATDVSGPGILQRARNLGDSVPGAGEGGPQASSTQVMEYARDI